LSDKLDYLQDLGINALYLNPIFSSASNHRYHAFDYMKVDPLLGGDAALRELLDEAHGRGIRVVLDGVFNHASRGFWPFHHILENGEKSPYLDWFIVHDWPLRPYSSGSDGPINYSAWWNNAALPKLNTDNPGVRDYLFEVARYWIDFGIDGWRLDVPNEIDDDSFWQEFRRVVKKANPEAYIVGEIWVDARRWLQGDQFDAVMNYIFTWIAMSYTGHRTLKKDYQHDFLPFKPLDGAGFAKEINKMYGLYDCEINFAHLNLLDSHDMPRALWLLGENESALKLAVFLMMTMPGAPCIYYGDEIGMSSDGDPHCRGAFPWDKPDFWDHDLLSFFRSLTALRNAASVLRTGDLQFVKTQGEIVAFRRTLEDQEALIVTNAGMEAATVEIPVSSGGATPFERVWPAPSGEVITEEGGNLSVTVPPRTGVVLKRKTIIT